MAPTRKAVWCFSLKAKSPIVPEAGQSVDVMYRTVPAKITIGPMKSISDGFNHPRHDGYIWCQKKTTLTKGQAELLLKENRYSELATGPTELTSSRAKYHSYCLEASEGANSKNQQTIKRHLDKLKADGIIPTKNKLEHSLAKELGLDFVAKKKRLIDKAMSMPEILMPEQFISESKIDMEQNVDGLLKAFSTYASNVNRAISNGGLCTEHKLVQDLTPEEQLNVILCISCLPCFVRRSRRIDNLPGLLYYGASGCGKSYLFDKIPFYRKVARDALGVSRFKLEGSQTAYLIDDVDPHFLTSDKNQSTVKELALGGTSTVKVCGDTKECRGWVVITSNAEPDFMTENTSENWTDESWKQNRKAWKRRFVSLKFVDICDPDPIDVDFETQHVRFVAAHTFSQAYLCLPDGNLRKSLEPYYNHACEHYTQGDVAQFIKARESNKLGESSTASASVEAAGVVDTHVSKRSVSTS